MKSKIVIGSDHAGFGYKSDLKAYLQGLGYVVVDIGTHDLQPVDYPDKASDLARTLIQQEIDKGILICGSGVGVSIAANKFRGIRAGVCHDAYSAHQGVEHDDMNVLCLGQRIVGIELAKDIIAQFLSARFSGSERHQRRLEKVQIIEEENLK